MINFPEGMNPCWYIIINTSLYFLKCYLMSFSYSRIPTEMAAFSYFTSLLRFPLAVAASQTFFVSDSPVLRSGQELFGLLLNWDCSGVFRRETTVVKCQTCPCIKGICDSVTSPGFPGGVAWSGISMYRSFSFPSPSRVPLQTGDTAHRQSWGRGELGPPPGEQEFIPTFLWNSSA